MENDLSRLTDLPIEGATDSVIERIIRFVGQSASVHTVYGQPVEGGGYTVIPAARVYFIYGGGSGPELGGKVIERTTGSRVAPSLSSGGGAGGFGIARPAGHIEIGPSGTRFVAATRDWRRPLAIGGAVALTLLARRLGRR